MVEGNAGPTSRVIPGGRLGPTAGRDAAVELALFADPLVIRSTSSLNLASSSLSTFERLLANDHLYAVWVDADCAVVV